jgi:2-polyprenyl-6-methoxyphenol hydroxylase-like FAD-dependent oxidoreductase
MASVVPVRLKPEADRDACWTESVEGGWLFLLATGSLIVVGGTPEALLAQSRLVAAQVDACIGEAREFASHPRILPELCAPGWFACGTAAMAFDPVCGEGAGNAVREAILAQAAVRGIQRGLDRDRVLALYESRLVAGFARHLEASREFYSRGGPGDWWREQVMRLDEGLTWTREKLSQTPPLRFRLDGFDLLEC